MTTPATPRPPTALEATENARDIAVAGLLAMTHDRDALLAALRALVDNAGHYSVPGFVAAIEQARALLRDLGEEGQ